MPLPTRLLRQPQRLLPLVALTLTAGLAWAAPPPGECPQPRFTGKAPDEFLQKKNPEEGKVDLRQAERIFVGDEGKANCAVCHGRKGDGKGELAMLYDPPPRNFACARTVNGIPDGQLFWIIRFGSPGTAMPPHPALKDEQIWSLVAFLRQLSK